MSGRTKIEMSQKEYDKKIDAIKVCGANRGPHDYIPTRWIQLSKDVEVVEELMCRICFSRVKMELLAKEFDEVTIPAQ
jgi:hypothetical protein